MLLLTAVLSFMLLVYRSHTAVVAYGPVPSLSLATSTRPPGQGEPSAAVERPIPTRGTRQHVLEPRAGLPSGVVEVGGFPAPLCITKDETNTQSSNREEPTGVMWAPGIPWYEPGQVIYIGTDTDGIVFENVFFSAPASDLNVYSTLLEAYSNSSGWSMTMPSTVPDASSE